METQAENPKSSIVTTALTWDGAKKSANTLLVLHSKNLIMTDPVKEIYDNQLHLALKDIAVKHFMNPDFYNGLEADLSIVRMALIIFDEKGFVAN